MVYQSIAISLMIANFRLWYLKKGFSAFAECLPQCHGKSTYSYALCIKEDNQAYFLRKTRNMSIICVVW